MNEELIDYIVASSVDIYKVDVDETKTFEGDITPSDQVEKLIILIEDSEDGVLYDEEVNIEFKKLPNLKITKFEW